MGDDRRNVVLVTFDSLRADHCGFVDDEVDLTPTLDGLAESGTVFETAVAPGPRTATSVPEFLTGEPMARHEHGSRAEKMASIRDHVETCRTVGTAFSEMGYSTAALSANVWASDRSGVADEFDEFRALGETDGTVVHKPGVRVLSGTPAGSLLYYLESWWRKRRNFAQWPTVFEGVVDTIGGLEEPYFAWIFLMDTHNPYIVPRADRTESSTLGMYYGLVRGNANFRHVDRGSYLDEGMPPGVDRRIREAYRDSVRSVDRFAGRLTDALADDGPAFVFHSDHGEAFGDHGGYGHQNALYEENIHVPLLVAGSDGDGERVSEPTSLRSLPALLASLADPDEGESERDGARHGQDSVAGQGDRAGQDSEYAVARTWTGETVAVRGDRWKYIRSDAGGELYDLDADPTERADVAAGNPDVVEELAERVERFRDGLPAAPEHDPDGVSLSADAKQRLETLGYTQ